MSEPRGILRNKDEKRERRELADELDRKEVIRNTMLNANLASESSKGDEIRAKIAKARKLSTGNGADVQEDEIDMPAFNLGESELDKQSAPQDSLNGGLIYVDPDQKYDEEESDDDKEEESKQLTAEERHKRFEEKRKQHYHMKALPLKQGVQLDEE